MSRQVVSTLAISLPLLYMIMAIDGDKKGMFKIGVPNSGSLISRVPSARAREKQIYASERYMPMIHATPNDPDDTTTIGEFGNMPTVGGAGGNGFLGRVNLTSGAITSVDVVMGGTNYSPNTQIQFVGGNGTGVAAHATVSGGVITAIVIDSGGSGYTIAPVVNALSSGTRHDLHFKRPSFGKTEYATPYKVSKKAMRWQKNLLNGLSRSEKEAALSSLLQSSIDEARVPHLTRIARELIGIQTIGDMGPSDQSATVWDHQLSLAASCHASNVYGEVDRSMAENDWWRGNRVTDHRAANVLDLFNEGNYTLGCSDIGLPIQLGFCGPSLFPQFVSQALANGGKIVYTEKQPEFGMFGIKRQIVQVNDMFVIYDPQIPDKKRIDPRTGTYFPTNAFMAVNPDTITVAFDPEAKFTVDEPFDQTKIEGGQNAFTGQIRTEIVVCNEAPKGSVYWEDVGSV